MVFPSDLFDFLEEEPLGRRVIFQSQIPGGLGFGQQQQLSSLFEPTFNQFLGQIGQELQQGQPQTSFRDFLQRRFTPQRELARFSNVNPDLATQTRLVFRG